MRAVAHRRRRLGQHSLLFRLLVAFLTNAMLVVLVFVGSSIAVSWFGVNACDVAAMAAGKPAPRVQTVGPIAVVAPAPGQTPTPAGPATSGTPRLNPPAPGAPVGPTLGESQTLVTDHGRWGIEQLGNARTIVRVGATLQLPPQAWVIAVATAMQESTLFNLHRGDRDSLGLFQQRPSAGWGTPTQILDAEYAAGKFYEALAKVPGWQSMSLTEAAQAVQRSAFPLAYAKWETDARAVVELVVPGSAIDQLMGPPRCGNGGSVLAIDGTGLPADFALPPDTPPGAAQAVAWALSKRGAPYGWGGSCIDPFSKAQAQRCDCSSLVMRAYEKAGIALPRTADEQINDSRNVQRIPISALRPGDLVAFMRNGEAQAHHIAIYIGYGMVVHAPKAGDVIKVSPLTAWSGEINQAGRVILPA